MTYIERIPKPQMLTGAQKSAIVFLCLGEEYGSTLMQQLDENEIRKITKAISDMGEVPSDLVVEVMQEFGVKVGEMGGVIGTTKAARAILDRFLPEDRVAAILEEIEGGQTGDIWKDLSNLDPNVLVEYLGQEQNQTVAVILSKLTSDIVAKIFLLLGQERTAEIVERMAKMSDLPKGALTNVENGLRQGLLTNDSQSVEAENEKHLINVFNKLDGEIVQEISEILEEKIPEKIQSIKKKMFVFDDLVKLKPNVLALVIREAGRKTLPLALRGAQKEIRDHFLNSLPQRSRDMLQEEMKAMGPVKSRDVKDSQTELVEITVRLAAAGQIEIPNDEPEEDMIA
jgi:flagellar motor switch protein FliG